MKLSIQRLNFAFGDKNLFDHFNLDIEEGEFVALVGPSGCGKSTLLNILAGIIKPQSGNILIDDEVVKDFDHFAYMPQEDLLLPWMNIMDNVTLYGRIHHHLKEAQDRASKEFLLFGLDGYQNAYPHELSGGMKQRAAFLRTALCEADILLLDEPFGALDVITRNEMQDWLLNQRKRLKQTILLVTHDVDEALYLADRIVVFQGMPVNVSKQIKINEKNRDRQWLYEQGELRYMIHNCLKGNI